MPNTMWVLKCSQLNYEEKKYPRLNHLVRFYEVDWARTSHSFDDNLKELWMKVFVK